MVLKPHVLICLLHSTSLQEQYFSPRAIFFMHDRIYYRCRHCEWAEDTFDDLKPLEASDRSLDCVEKFRSSSVTPRGFYVSIMIEITKRVLTKQEDAERAATGLLRRASALMKCAFLEGLPTASFDMELIFSPTGTGRRRRYGFPSYSWTGWIGKSYPVAHDFGGDYNGWLSYHTWIVWYKRTRSGDIDPVWNVSQSGSDPEIAQSAICYGERHPIDLNERHSFGFSTAQKKPTLELYFESPIPRYSLLQFWTLVVHLHVRQYSPDYHPRGYISDTQGIYCGTIFFDSTEGIKSLLRDRQPLEFVVLSQRWAKDGNLWDYRERPIPFREPPYSHSKLHNLYWVMLIEWRGGIAERKAIGSIWQEAVENSFPPGPVWKEIVLG
jgi:hypothetical protein